MKIHPCPEEHEAIVEYDGCNSYVKCVNAQCWQGPMTFGDTREDSEAKAIEAWNEVVEAQAEVTRLRERIEIIGDKLLALEILKEKA